MEKEPIRNNKTPRKGLKIQELGLSAGELSSRIGRKIETKVRKFRPKTPNLKKRIKIINKEALS
jgi:hypothetical protein